MEASFDVLDAELALHHPQGNNRGACCSTRWPDGLAVFMQACSWWCRVLGVLIEVVAALQAISEPDERYEAYCRSSDFIREHVFPGGHLPCMSECPACFPASRTLLHLALLWQCLLVRSGSFFEFRLEQVDILLRKFAKQFVSECVASTIWLQ